ncbi:MAG: prolyl oligopeptidase family serine peptidase [Acidobacteriota bacterium]
MRRLLVLLAASACVHPPPKAPMTWPALDAQLLADSAATFNFRLGLPAPLAITADGAVLFRRTPPRSFAADLYELDTKTGAVKTLVTAAELLGTGEEHLSDAERARRERTRTATRGVVDIDVSDDGRTVLVPLGGKLYLVDRGSGARTVIDPHGDAYDPHLSPDGTKIAFVRGGDLWVVARGGAPRQLTKHPDGFEYGVADFAAMEELDRRRGFWWSPDSTQLVFERADNRPVDTIYVADALHNDRPPVPFKYPRAGTANAVLSLAVVSVDGGEPTAVSWDNATFPYLARVSWPKRGPMSFLVLTREQDKLRLATRDGFRLEELGTKWLDVPRPGGIGYVAGTPLWLADGSFLWASEGAESWVLYQQDRHGLHRALTTPDFGLRKLVGFDEAAHEAIVEASTDPTKQDIWRVPLAGGAPRRVTGGEGVATAAFDHGVLIVSTALAAGGKRTVAIAGGKTLELPSVAEQPPLVPTTKLEIVTLGGRTHHVAITRPRAFDPANKYPVILKVYAGPHLQMVEDARDGYVMDQWYADAGFIVVRSDGRGTPNRGVAWERAIYQDLITVPLEDQVAALQAMGARHREMDLSRVGVTGWSFGGYFSTMAVLLRPDVFKCAVAGAPVTDWKLYDTAYTERYMRTPEHNPAGYAHTSALTHAAKLARPLLIIHGITDDNVHFAHTLAFIEALYVAGKYANVITLSATHMVPEPALALAREKVQLDFFREHLGPPP